MRFLVCFNFFFSYLSADKRDWKEAWNGWRLRNLARSYFTEWKSGGERMRSQRNRKGGHEQWDKTTSAQGECTEQKKIRLKQQQRKQTPVENRVREAVCQTPRKHRSSEMKVLFSFPALLLQCHRWITPRLTLMSLRAHEALPHIIGGWLTTDTVHFAHCTESNKSVRWHLSKTIISNYYSLEKYVKLLSNLDLMWYLSSSRYQITWPLRVNRFF